MAAWLTSEEGRDIDKIAFALQEAKNMGLSVLPPDINESFVDFGVIKETGEISYALSSIKNVGRQAAENIVKERKQNGKFKSLDDFLSRNGSNVANKKIIESLARAGALDKLGERNQILAGIDVILKFIQNQNKAKNSNQLGLFKNAGSKTDSSIINYLPKVPPASKNQRLIWEKELLGMYISEHPLTEFAHIFKKSFITKINDLLKKQKNQTVNIAGIITKVQKINTKNNAEMAFMVIEDLGGQVEVVVFPKIFEQSGFLLQKDMPVSVLGKTTEKDGVKKILADKIDHISNIKESELYLTLKKNSSKELLFSIKEIIAAHSGKSMIILRIPKNGQYKEVRANKKVEISDNLISKLNSILGDENIKVK
jgi:DNA polymerase-3 subunit alpha